VGRDLRRRATDERRTRAVAVLALAWGIAYLTWRVGWTHHGVHGGLYAVLLVAEAVGWVSLALFAFLAWRVPAPPTTDRTPARSDLTVDVLVPTYDEPVEVLRATLLGCRALRYPHTTWLLDDGRRPELAELARELGARYLTRPDNRHAKAGNINHALGHLEGDLVAVLDADHVPLPHFLDTMVRYFEDPDVVLACAGDVPTLEVLAAADILRRKLPELNVRVVNVVDLMRLQDEREHPHGLSDRDFDTIFTADKPIIFAYHGYPWLIHRLTYRRNGHANLHVRGYKEEGTTTTPFDMVMLNDLDRYHLVMDVIDRVPSLGARAAELRQEMMDARLRARQYTRDHGEDIPEVAQWVWPDAGETATEVGGPQTTTLSTGGDNE